MRLTHGDPARRSRPVGRPTALSRRPTCEPSSRTATARSAPFACGLCRTRTNVSGGCHTPALIGAHCTAETDFLAEQPSSGCPFHCFRFGVLPCVRASALRPRAYLDEAHPGVGSRRRPGGTALAGGGPSRPARSSHAWLADLTSTGTAAGSPTTPASCSSPRTTEAPSNRPHSRSVLSDRDLSRLEPPPLEPPRR